MTQEKDVKRPIQELEHAPIAKIDTPERDQTETNNKTHQALKTALTLAEPRSTPAHDRPPYPRRRTF